MPCPTLTDRLDRDYPGLEVRRDNDLFESTYAGVLVAGLLELVVQIPYGR
jgi:hypothetical protein